MDQCVFLGPTRMKDGNEQGALMLISQLILHPFVADRNVELKIVRGEEGGTRLVKKVRQTHGNIIITKLSRALI